MTRLDLLWAALFVAFSILELMLGTTAARWPVTAPYTIFYMVVAALFVVATVLLTRGDSKR